MKVQTIRACLPCLRDFRYGKTEFGSQNLQIRMPVGCVLVIVQRCVLRLGFQNLSSIVLLLDSNVQSFYPVCNPSIVKINYQLSMYKSLQFVVQNKWNPYLSYFTSFFPLIQYLLLGIARHGFVIRMISPLISTFDGLGQRQEGIAVGRSFAMFKNYNIDGNKEMIAFGMMNIVGSCTSCYLTTGNSF